MAKEKDSNYVIGRAQSKSARRRISGYHFRIERYIEEAVAKSKQTQSSPRALTDQDVQVPEEMRTHLDLSNFDLFPDEFTEIVDDLRPLTEVTVLLLSRNRLDGDSLELLLSAMPQLEYLGLSENRISQKDACRVLAQFPKLRTLDVTNTMLQSEHLEELVASNTLLKVHFMRNPKVDLVRQARVLAACDYNNQALIKKNMGVKPAETKDDYIRNNLTRFVKQAKKAQDDLAAADKESVENFFRDQREKQRGIMYHLECSRKRHQAAAEKSKTGVKSHQPPHGKLFK